MECYRVAAVGHEKWWGTVTEMTPPRDKGAFAVVHCMYFWA